jgi:hypothetical protein
MPFKAGILLHHYNISNGQRFFNRLVGGWQRHSSGRGFDSWFGVKKFTLSNSTQSTWSRSGHSLCAMDSLCTGGQSPYFKAQVKNRLMSRSYRFLCMGGCGIRGIFLNYVNTLFVNIKPWGQPFPYRSSFFIIYQMHAYFLEMSSIGVWCHSKLVFSCIIIIYQMHAYFLEMSSFFSKEKNNKNGWIRGSWGFLGLREKTSS